MVAAGLFISYSTCCSQHCTACSQGGVPLNIIAFSRQTKTRMWFDRYLANNGMLLLCLIMLSTLKNAP